MKTRQLVIFALFMFVAFAATWCICDYFFVHASEEAKQETQKYEWGYALFPFLVSLAVLKKKDSKMGVRILLSIGTFLVFAIACMIWMMTCGIIFHFSIGGNL